MNDTRRQVNYGESPRLDSQAAGEPVLGSPQPSGLTFTAAKNSPVIRGVVFNQGLQAQGFTPNAVATLEDLTGRVGSTQQALDFERAGITDNVGALNTDTPATVCGFPSTNITYNLQGRTGDRADHRRPGQQQQGLGCHRQYPNRRAG
jgi:hypothetical protein